ncbi:hypothetical protein KW803_01925 [Candidatus Saccharibacteria bacterium]|nr:hypothetical protein [Candidatus Saccharibacteria bacterium]
MPKRKTANKRAVKKKSKNRFFIPFPLILFLLLCAGVYLVNSTFRAEAQDIQVTAQIQGPAVTDPPVITSPADGTHFSAVPVVVQGNCPANAAYVEIFRNNIMSGTAICTSGGTFSLEIDLFAGSNEITSRAFNVNDNAGPVSGIFTVYYDSAQPVSVPGQPTGSSQDNSSQGSGSSGSESSAISPLILKTVFVYKGYYVDQEVIWPLDISGGSKPYAFNVDWGDGTNSVISRKSDGPFNIKHKYKKPGGYKGQYTIKVQASDADANYAYLEFFILVSVKSDDVFNASNIFNKQPPALGSLNHWLWIAWPVYSTIFLMTVSYKLGEWEELRFLRHGHFLKRSH